MTHSIKHSSCYMCSEDCPISVEFDGQRIVAIEHPNCVRASAMLEQRESSHRLLSARIRKSSRTEWQSDTWENVVAHTADKLNDVKDQYGPESVAFVVGFTKEVRPYLSRLANAFGSPHYLTESSCCFGATFVAARITFGSEYEYYLGPSRRSSPETRCRLAWSTNPTESMLPYDNHHLIKETERVPTIVVDPRETGFAKRADIHLRPRPGTDGALALGFAHVIFDEELEDKIFLDKHAFGLHEFKDYVGSFSPKNVSNITGIPQELIVKAARLYGRSKPSQITISPCATTHHSNGFQSHRAILLLSAICGNLDVEGGNRPWDERLREKDVSLRGDAAVSSRIPLGSSEHPLFAKHFSEAQAMRLSQAIECGAVKALFSIGMNMMMWPNSKRFASALESLEFFSTCDFFENPTTNLATAFFPAATHLERRALVVSPKGRIQLRPAVEPPLGDAHGDTELVFQLAKMLDLESRFWGGNIEESFRERLDGTGVKLDDLGLDGKPIEVSPPIIPEKAFEQHGFGTPTGKVEFVSTELEAIGAPGLPEYVEPFWSPVSSPLIAESYPLVLTTGGRSINFTHSQGRNLEKLKKREPFPRVQIHPSDAAKRGIESDDWVSVSSPLGSVSFRAWITDIVLEGVVHVPHGWAGHNINELIPDEGLDPYSGFPPFRSSLCEVSLAVE